MSRITIKIKSAEAARQLSAAKLGPVAGNAAKGSALAVKSGASHAAGIGPHTHPIASASGHALLQTTAGGAAKAGTIWSGTGTGLGLGLGLGFYGPMLLVASLGLMATGIYIFVRNQQVRAGGEPVAAD